LASINIDHGRELGLMRGANVVMPNLTPAKYRAMYEIYPSKACMRETASECHFCLTHRIQSIGRRAGIGRGDRIHRVDFRSLLPAEIEGKFENENFSEKALLL
jgi:biotin synthase